LAPTIEFLNFTFVYYPSSTYKSGDYCKPFKSSQDEVIIQIISAATTAVVTAPGTTPFDGQ
jgi:hypothetical protein